MTDDRRRWLQLGLAMIGAASLLGTLVSAAYTGTVMALRLLDENDQET